MLKLFVYGTLKSGQYNNIYLAKGNLLGVATLEGYDMYTNGGYPYITKGNNIVHGEVWEIEDERSIKNIRMLESGYDETDVVVTMDGVEVKAKAYTFPQAREDIRWRKVEDGVFN